MGKIIQISIYSVLLILVFLFFGSLLKSCGNVATEGISDTTQRVADNIESAGGEIVAKAESALEDISEEFEGGDIDFSDNDAESKSYTSNTKKPDPVKTTTTATSSSDDNEDYEPSYVVDESPEPVRSTPVKKEPIEKAPVKKETSSTSSSASSTSGGSSGRYLLITGNYSQEFNADAMVKKLKNKGYSNAEHVIFEGSRYYTVLAGKYSSMSAANSAKANLGNIDAYVQKRRD